MVDKVHLIFIRLFQLAITLTLLFLKFLPSTWRLFVIRRLLRFFYRVEVKGLDNYHAAGNKFIVIVNHPSYLDKILLASFLPDKFICVVKTNQCRWCKPWQMLIEPFFIEAPKPMAIRTLIQRVASGEKCIVFPEHGNEYECSAFIADQANVLLLPIRIDGAQYTLFSRQRNKVRTRWFSKIHVSILPAQKLKLAEPISNQKSHHVLGEQLYKIISQLNFATRDYHHTLYSKLLEARKIHRGRFIIAEDIQRKPMSYNQLVMRSIILGKKIGQQSQPNEAIGLLLPTSNAAITCFFACHVVGRIPTLLNYSAGPKNILSACQTAQLKIVYTAKIFIHKANLHSVIEQLEAAHIHVIFLDELANTISLAAKICGFIASKYAHRTYRHLAPEIEPLDAAVILFTSGSEGTPKGVVLNHENLLANCYQMEARIDFNSSDVVLNVLPIFHCFGLTAGSILPILTGIRTFFYPSPLHYRIIPQLAHDLQATILFGTDTFLSGYARHARPGDFNSVRYIFAGAEKLTTTTYQQWQKQYAIHIFEGYGATETAPVLATNTPLQNKMGTVGCFLPGIDYQVKPVDGIKQGGRLFVKGPNIMRGYIRAEQAGVIQSPQQGWYDTGDIVDIDTQGYITILGRSKRFAKIAGEMISLTAVETLIHTIWPDYQHAVVSIPDKKKGEQLVLVTNCLTANRQHMIQEARKHGYQELSIPKTIKVVNEIPVLATGKTDYTQLVEKIALT